MKSKEFDNKAEVFQETMSMTEHIKKFMDGEHVLDDQLSPSKDFDSDSEVDFNADLTPSHHDIYDVAAGIDKVYPEKVETTPVSSPDVVEPNVETNSTE